VKEVSMGLRSSSLRHLAIFLTTTNFNRKSTGEVIFQEDVFMEPVVDADKTLGENIRNFLESRSILFCSDCFEILLMTRKDGLKRVRL
jgi:hypothetical protein